jgi:type IV pilus assembly protein PilQ
MSAKKALLGLTLVASIWLAAGAVAPASAQSGSAMSQVGMQRTGAGTFSLDVTGADLRTVLRAISEFSGRNIVLGTNAKASVSIQLRNVAWQDALKAVLRSSGLDYTEDGAIIRVDDAARLNAEKVEREQANARTQELVPLETRIIRLNYANAAEMGPPLMPALSKRGSIQIERRTNSLVVTDLPAHVETLARMAQDLDSTTPQIEITAKLVDVDVASVRDLGIKWGVGAESEYFVDNVSGDPIPGLAPNPANGIYLSGEHNTPANGPLTKLNFGIFRDWGSLEAQLQTLEEQRKANIISNPRITTVDNREAKIVVGQKIPLITQDVAGNPVSQLQTIGIQLRVMPHLTSDRKIILDLHPEVSDLSTQSTVQGGIIINTSEADTRVMVEDGQTAVIGGLIRTNESMVHRGIPLLKDIPVLGILFSQQSKVRQNRELIIFVTPRLIEPVAAK